MYVDTLLSDSSDPEDYNWTLIKGDPGQAGLNSYLHIAYANNSTGTSGFSTTVSVGKTYLGQYVSNDENQSTDPTLYKWSLIKGADGSVGDRGPGLVFQGEFSSARTYFYDADRRDVVKYNDIYYVVKNLGSTMGSFSSANWSVMNNFKSVATDILLANDATITKGLVMGTASEKGFIRSYGANSLTSGSGFYMDGDGKFMFGNSQGNKITWDGSDLVVNGTATFAGTASYANSAGAADTATNATNANNATNAINATNASYATNAGSATTATLAATANAVNGQVRSEDAGGWKIDSEAIYTGTKRTTNGYTTSGITLHKNGALWSPNFRLDTDGAAYFKGRVDADSGYIGGWTIAGTYLTNGNALYGAYTRLSPTNIRLESRIDNKLVKEVRLDNDYLKVGMWDDLLDIGQRVYYQGNGIHFNHDSGQTAGIGFKRAPSGPRAIVELDGYTNLKDMSLGDYRIDTVITDGALEGTIELQTFLIQVDTLRCMMITTGSLTVGSTGGTASFEMPVDMWLATSRASVQATMRRQSDSGSGVDVVYSNISGSGNGVIYFTHDFASTSQNRVIDFTIIGYTLMHV